MSQQTDQLLLMYNEQPEKEPAALVTSAQEIANYRDRLRLLTDLKNHKGYQILIEALRSEAQHSLFAMDKAEGGSQMVKHGANYFSLTMAMGFVDNELLRLTTVLKAAKAL